MQFTLTIDITADNVRRELDHLAQYLEQLARSPQLTAAPNGRVFGENGQHIGKWEIIEPIPRIQPHPFEPQELSDACALCGKIEAYAPMHPPTQTAAWREARRAEDASAAPWTSTESRAAWLANMTAPVRDLTAPSFDPFAAEAEGWILADDSERGLEIQRLDVAEKFDGDAAAAAHVQKMADQGDKNAAEALRQIKLAHGWVNWYGAQPDARSEPPTE